MIEADFHYQSGENPISRAKRNYPTLFASGFVVAASYPLLENGEARWSWSTNGTPNIPNGSKRSQEIEMRYDGWTPLIDEVLNAAEKIMAEHPQASFRVAQIKQKLGGLRIYVHHEGLPEDVSNSIERNETRRANGRSTSVKSAALPLHWAV